MNDAGIIGYAHVKEWKTRPVSFVSHKINSKWTHNINKTWNYENPRRKQKQICFGVGLGIDFFIYDT